MTFALWVADSSDKKGGKAQRRGKCSVYFGTRKASGHLSQLMINQPNKLNEGQISQSGKYSRGFLYIV